MRTQCKVKGSGKAAILTDTTWNAASKVCTTGDGKTTLKSTGEAACLKDGSTYDDLADLAAVRKACKANKCLGGKNTPQATSPVNEGQCEYTGYKWLSGYCSKCSGNCQGKCSAGGKCEATASQNGEGTCSCSGATTKEKCTGSSNKGTWTAARCSKGDTGNLKDCEFTGNQWSKDTEANSLQRSLLGNQKYEWIGEDCVGKEPKDHDACAAHLTTAEKYDGADWKDKSTSNSNKAISDHKCTKDTKCQYVPRKSEPLYSAPMHYTPKFQKGAGGFKEGGNAKREDDLWTPKNPLTVTSLQFECKTPALFMDYWSVFGIPRAPRTDYSGLDPTKCDSGEEPVGNSKTRSTKCGPRSKTDSTCGKDKPQLTYTRYGECGDTSKIGDGVCDPEFNHAIFLYDELDCFYSAMEEISGSSMSFGN